MNTAKAAKDDLYVAREGTAYALYSRTTRCAIVRGRKRSLAMLLRQLIEREAREARHA